LSLDQNDNDLLTFTAYLIAAVQTLFPAACRGTEALLSAPDPPPASVLATSLLNELDRIEQPFLLVLDDYFFIKESEIHDLLTAVLKHPPHPLHLVVVSRHDPPLPIPMMRAQSQLAEIRTQDLRFTPAETAAFFKLMTGTQIDASTIEALEKKIEGWVTGLYLTTLLIRHRGDIDPRLLDPQMDVHHVMEYLFREVFSGQPSEINQYLLATAILDRFCGPLCEAVCVPGDGSATCELGGWDFIAWLKRENLFLIPLDHEHQWFRYHHLFQKLLANQLKRHCSTDEIKALHVRAGAWFVENGLIEESLRHTLAVGDVPAAVRLAAQYGQNMMNGQQWQQLNRILHMLPRDQVQREPALIILQAWLEHVRQNASGMTACIERIEALNTASAPDALVNVKYAPGHFEALRGFLYYVAAEGESALAFARRALENIPLHHKRARLFADIFQLGAYQMVGNLETGMSLYKEAMDRYIGRDRNYHAMYMANLNLIYWMDADLTAVQQTSEGLLNLVKGKQQPAITAYALYFTGIVHYHRNELRNAVEKLAEVVKAYHAHSPMNFAHSAFALALAYQARGHPDRAREISKSVVMSTVETNNADMQSVARAFEAELALRQGRLTAASRWAKKYQAKPFRPVYRFYMPQLTLVKTMLAEGTTPSLQMAADLLDQLLDFLESIHNNRFRIDALALQALLHDARGEKASAAEKLSQALTMAAPGEFIRPFADLGRPMADLLKRVARQNIAVGYIGRILAAFREDAHGPMQDGPDQLAAPSSTQPLVEALTNRERQILDLLAERLQNKEIADKLFVSPETIKKHLSNIYHKLNVATRLEAIEKARALGFFPPR
jgi:LuxR family maltose regulon positive regulatory protein